MLEVQQLKETRPPLAETAFNHSSQCAYQVEKLQRVRNALSRLGFDSLPPLVLQPTNPAATPVTLVTGVSFATFDARKHIDTPTKCYYAPTGRRHLVNTSGAVALTLLEQDKRVLLHVSAQDYEKTIELLALHPKAALVSIITGDLPSIELVTSAYETMIEASRAAPISRVDFVLYESYAAGIEHPFVPLFEDSPEFAGRVTSRRISAFHNLFMVGYDLLINRDQEELRVIGLTALAGRRASGNLSTDTLHKVVSSALLETQAYEASYYTEKPVFVVEIAPGMVDTGTYDPQHVREAVIEEAVIDGFPFPTSLDAADPMNWPMLNVRDLAEVAGFYLGADPEMPPATDLVERHRSITTAGRSAEELRELFEESRHGSDTASTKTGSLTRARRIPSYGYTAGTTWDGIQQLRRGYTPVMLTPIGQLF